MRVSQPTGFEQAEADLYGRPRSEFTAARDAAVRQARTAGEDDLAEAIRELRKPTVSAWLVNVLVRERPEDVDRLTELGAELRKAQAGLDADSLRRLSEERPAVVASLTREARRLAAGRGERISDAVERELERTLEAVSFDPMAEEQVRGGRLTVALAYSGLGFPSEVGGRQPVRSTGSSKVSPRTSRSRSPSGSPSGRPAGNSGPLAQREARDARRDARRAATVLAAAEEALQRACAALDAAQAEVAHRREAVRAAQREVRRARGECETSERGARRAEERSGAATRQRT